MKKLRVAGINFAHMHMHDLLGMVRAHPGAEVVGICDEKRERMSQSIGRFSIPAEQAFTDYRACMEKTKPDLVILCAATAEHALWTKRVAPYGVHVFVEKPFAASLRQADEMITAVKKTGRQLIINWPLRWYPPHITAKRLIDEGRIGRLEEVRYYDGNRGPLRHTGGKIEVLPTPAMKRKSWFYQKKAGGGSLLDYLGYGTTLGTWFMDGRAPIEVTTTVDQPRGLEIDEHSVTVVRYAGGLSTFETRWGTFTDPWKLQPQPKCGFVLIGREGTISSYDYESTIRVQTAKHPEGKIIPVDKIRPPFNGPITYTLHCLATGRPIEGPLSPRIARIGQQIVDTAILSAAKKKTVKLLP